MKRKRGGKQFLYLGPVYEEMEREAQRLDRSIGWLTRRAWRIALAELRQLPPRAPDDHEGKPYAAAKGAA